LSAFSISRRQFLKLLGFGITFFALGGFNSLTKLIDRQSFTRLVSAQTVGSWSNGKNTTTTPIHAALLTNGKIFYLAGSGYSTARQFGPYEAKVLDYKTGTEKTLTQNQDLFCAGQTTLANGNLLLAGGTLQYNGNPDNCNGRWHGLNAAYEFNVGSETLTKVTNMRHGRWYPTLVTLPDGKVWCCSGYDEYGVINRIVEVYDPSSKTWALIQDPNSNYTYVVGAGFETTCPGPHPTYSRTCPPVSFYPRTHLMPKGLLVVCGMRREIWSWNRSNGDFVFLTNSSVYRDYGTSFLCPLQNTAAEKGKILLVGGSATSSSGDYATTACEMLDFNASSTSVPIRRTVSPLVYRRKFFAPVILPNGRLLVLGGAEQGNTRPVYRPEIFDPATETWQSNLPASSVPRVYHCVALLLPDGRVWNAGGNSNNGVWELRTQFFSPDYLFKGARPTIPANPTVGSYGGTITIPTSYGSSITAVSLVRLMNTTHHYDANQRLVWLQITSRGSSSITVSAPINSNIAPPGYYMIHILNGSGVPSVARIIKIPK
jgi:hypothetical protein